MTIAEKIITDWNNKKPWALGDWGPEDLKDVVELIATVAERGIEEACKKVPNGIDEKIGLRVVPCTLKRSIRVNRWWEEEER